MIKLPLPFMNKAQALPTVPRVEGPAPLRAVDDLQNVSLISREDVYSDGNPSVLLLKAGTEIQADLLPKLVNCGADPRQFMIKADSPADETLATVELFESALPETITPSLPNRQALRAVRESLLAHKHVLVLDRDLKSLKRTMDSLSTVGYAMGKIHPVRLHQYLGWMLDKYQPDLLVIDYDLRRDEFGRPQSTAIDVLLNHASQLEQVAQIIMTIPVGGVQPDDQPRLFEAVEALQIDVIFKPVQSRVLESLISI